MRRAKRSKSLSTAAAGQLGDQPAKKKPFGAAQEADCLNRRKAIHTQSETYAKSAATQSSITMKSAMFSQLFQKRCTHQQEPRLEPAAEHTAAYISRRQIAHGNFDHH